MGFKDYAREIADQERGGQMSIGGFAFRSLPGAGSAVTEHRLLLLLNIDPRGSSGG